MALPSERPKTQAQRIADNEAMFRRANEHLHRRYRELDIGDERLPFICECADERCTETVTLTLDDYHEVRRHPDRYLIVPGHELPGAERVVDESPGFSVVEKPAPDG
jgi:hypothetical protein